MSEPDDDDALNWAGDDSLLGPGTPAPRLIHDRDTGSGARASGGGFALLVLGVLGGVAVIETVFWLRSAFELQIAASLDPGGGTPLEVVSFAINVVGRALAVLAPVIWFAVILWRVRAPSRRIALLALGAVLLLPWPAILAAA